MSGEHTSEPPVFSLVAALPAASAVLLLLVIIRLRRGFMDILPSCRPSFA